MKKIPTIFKRDPDNMQLVVDVMNPVCDWVFKGEGVVTRKYDGTCCMIKHGVLFKRREIKTGKEAPENFILAEFDINTGKSFGWVPVNPDDKADRWHVAAFQRGLPDGTYELVGPKIQGNPERVITHNLVDHSKAAIFSCAQRTFEEIKYCLSYLDVEGFVFKHDDGRMGKIKQRDFGLAR